jgi:hypothetical protein
MCGLAQLFGAGLLRKSIHGSRIDKAWLNLKRRTSVFSRQAMSFEETTFDRQ